MKLNKEMQVKKQTPAPIPVLVRVPPALLKKLDTASNSQGRSRSSELCVRLADSFKQAKPAKAGV